MPLLWVTSSTSPIHFISSLFLSLQDICFGKIITVMRSYPMSVSSRVKSDGSQQPAVGCTSSWDQVKTHPGKKYFPHILKPDLFFLTFLLPPLNFKLLMPNNQRSQRATINVLLHISVSLCSSLIARLENYWVWRKIQVLPLFHFIQPLGQWLMYIPQCICDENVGTAHTGFMLCADKSLGSTHSTAPSSWWCDTSSIHGVTVSLWCYYNNTSEITCQRDDFFSLIFNPPWNITFIKYSKVLIT